VTAIKRTIRVNFEHQVHFTDGVFDLSNPLLKDILTGPAPRAALARALEALAGAGAPVAVAQTLDRLEASA